MKRSAMKATISTIKLILAVLLIIAPTWVISVLPEPIGAVVGVIVGVGCIWGIFYIYYGTEDK